VCQSGIVFGPLIGPHNLTDFDKLAPWDERIGGKGEYSGAKLCRIWEAKMNFTNKRLD